MMRAKMFARMPRCPNPKITDANGYKVDARFSYAMIEGFTYAALY
jgi:hypothetical protein